MQPSNASSASNPMYFFSSENDILRELEELSLEAQGIRADRDAAAVKVRENSILPVSAVFLAMFWELPGLEMCGCRYINSFYNTSQREELNFQGEKKAVLF